MVDATGFRFGHARSALALAASTIFALGACSPTEDSSQGSPTASPATVGTTSAGQLTRAHTPSPTDDATRSFRSGPVFEFASVDGWSAGEAPSTLGDVLWLYLRDDTLAQPVPSTVIGSWTKEDILQSSLDSYLDTMISSGSASEIDFAQIDGHYTRAVHITDDIDDVSTYYVYVLYDDGYLTMTAVLGEGLSVDDEVAALEFVRSLRRL